MANAPQRLIDRFLVVSGSGKIQPSKSVGILDADLTTRDACTVTREEVILRTEVRDCKQRDLVDEKIRTRGVRFTIAYKEVTPQILARWAFYFFGSSAYTAGSPANEVQTLTRSGTVSSGSFKLQLDLEGFIVQTKAIAWNATTSQIQSALTESWMEFIQPGDVVVTGTWGAGMVLTFGGRLRKANLPLFTVDNALIGGGGSVAIAQTTAGAQHLHEIDRSEDDEKVRFSIAIGWDDVEDRVEKYVGLACETFQPSIERRQPVGLTVTVVGPWTPELLTAFDIPDCVSIDALMADDCRVEIDSNWETSDVNQNSYNLNDNVPLDETTAYSFAGMDIQNMERGDQPTQEITAGVFGSETDALYQIALNERTADPVDYRTHFGQPGDRFSLISPATKIKFQQNPLGTAGTLNESVIQITGTPYKASPDLPIRAEAYLDQAVAFGVVSS